MSETARPRRRGRLLAERLSSADWVDKALALLLSEGIAEVKISRLCDEFGVTKGSFYWHFADIAALVEAVADRWCADATTAHDQLAELEDLPPVRRMELMTARLIGDDSLRVERTLREWAVTHERVAARIAASDRHVFELVESALAEMGHRPDEARIRAGALVYAGIGFAHGQHALGTPTDQEIGAIIALLTGLGPPSSPPTGHDRDS